MRLSSFNSKAIAANFAAWMLFITVTLFATVFDSIRAGREVDLAHRAVSYLISFGPWVLITPVFYLLLKKQQQKPNFSILRTFILLMIVWLPLAQLFDTLSSIFDRNITDKTFFEVYFNLPFFYWVYQFMLFSIVFGCCFSLLYYRRANHNKMEAFRAKQENAELQLQLSELRMQSLQTQLEPHFLFNSLNSIASLIRLTEKKSALTAIKQLSDLLRYAVEASNHAFVSLDSELDFVKDYLALQALRFEDKLEFKINDQRTANNLECPPFLMQIFVENAIRHGLELTGESMLLQIDIDNRKENIFFRIKNTHQQIESNNQGLGIGLKNLQDRLSILYHQAVQLDITETKQEYRVELTLPAPI